MSDFLTNTDLAAPPGFSPPGADADVRQRARDRRLAALALLAKRRARGETEMIVRARRRHERMQRAPQIVR